jgi:hypothetical protein
VPNIESRCNQLKLGHPRLAQAKPITVENKDYRLLIALCLINALVASRKWADMSSMTRFPRAPLASARSTRTRR